MDFQPAMNSEREIQSVQLSLRDRIAQILNNHGSNHLYKLEQIRKLIEDEGKEEKQ